jgi:hypothetical protein
MDGLAKNYQVRCMSRATSEYEKSLSPYNGEMMRYNERLIIGLEFNRKRYKLLLFKLLLFWELIYQINFRLSRIVWKSANSVLPSHKWYAGLVLIGITIII